MRDKGLLTCDRGQVSRTITAMCKTEILKGVTINTREKSVLDMMKEKLFLERPFYGRVNNQPLQITLKTYHMVRRWKDIFLTNAIFVCCCIHF